MEITLRDREFTGRKEGRSIRIMKLILAERAVCEDSCWAEFREVRIGRADAAGKKNGSVVERSRGKPCFAWFCLTQ
jgi:hypothetical protein